MPQPTQPSSSKSPEALLEKGLHHHQKGDLAEAVKNYQLILAKQPENANAMQLLGVANLQSGNLENARQLLESALKIDPNMAQAHCNLGNVYSNLGQNTEAVLSYQQAIRIDSNLLQAHFQLAETYARTGQPDAAIKCYQSALALQPNNINTLDKLGNCYGESGDYQQAINCFQKVLKLAQQANPTQLVGYRYKLALSQFHLGNFEAALQCHQEILSTNPDFADSYHDLGLIYQQQKKTDLSRQNFQQAIKLNPQKAMYYFNLAKLNSDIDEIDQTLFNYKKAVELEPNLIEAYRSLAAFCHRHHDHRQAIEALSPALERFPENTDILFDTGIYYENWGQPENALPYYQQVLALEPDNEEAKASIAAVRTLEGRYDDAYEILAPLINLENPSFRTVSCFAEIAHRFDQQDTAIKTMQTALKNPDTAAKGIAELHFLMGKISDRKKDYEIAFKHYSQGNRLIKPEFDHKASSQSFDQLISAHSKKRHYQLAHSIEDTDTPIFIIGMERSGTSLLEQILASHPKIHGAGELGAIPDIIYNMPDSTQKPYPQCAGDLNSEQLNKFAEQYLQIATQNADDAIRITDKLPGNFVNLGLIELIFPNARIIHAKRDPLDTCISCYFQQFGGDLPYTYDLEDLGFYYQEYERLMDHWKSVIQLPILEMQYEEVVDSSEEKIKQLIEFSGVEWDERCQDFHKTKRTVATASSDQVRTPMYQSSVKRWKNYESQIQSLKEILENRESA